jgi:hypothetical protein
MVALRLADVSVGAAREREELARKLMKRVVNCIVVFVRRISKG